MSIESLFSLKGRVAIITGGSGLLGINHCEIISEAGGIPVLWDIDPSNAEIQMARITRGGRVQGKVQPVDITNSAAIDHAINEVVTAFGRIDVLINNASNNPQVDSSRAPAWTRLEAFPEVIWDNDLAVGLKGAFLCSRAAGRVMAGAGRGVILNIASDLGIIAPDQRIYRQDGLPDSEQPVKPVTYSVVKHGLIGLTRYLATYWATQGVRVNSLSPGGIYEDQPAQFVERLTNLIPMGRMASEDEYKGAVLFLISDASSYMTGSNVSIDGGRTCW